MTGTLSGKVILITGAGRETGMGAATARRLIAEGAVVICSDLPDSPGPGFEHERLHYMPHDVTREAEWDSVLARAEDCGGLYGLVNNAAFYRPRPLDDTDPADFRLTMDVNTYGAFLGLQRAARVMKPRRDGAIVNISSTAGMRGSARAFAYSASKWALRGMSKSAAMDLAGHNIRVNCIFPGQTQTDMILAYSEEQRRQRLESIPLRRNASAAEIAKMICHLLSPESSFVTGAEIAIDGGFTL